MARFRETVAGTLLVCVAMAIAPTAGSSLPEPPLAESSPPTAEAGEAESEEIVCVGDSCQSLPAEPEDPTPGTLVPNSGNPPLRIFEPRKPAKKRRKGHHGRHRRGGAHGAERPTR